MKVISFVNMKGGVGKTTLAINVAHCLASLHEKKVAVIDIDPQFNATQCFFSGDEYVELLKADADTVVSLFDDAPRTITSSVSGTQVAEPKELANISLQSKHDLAILPGNIDLFRIEMTSGEGREFALRRFIEEGLDDSFEYVIIDTPPTPSIWMSSALIASQYYVIPVKPDPMSVIGIDLLKSIIDRKKKNFGLKLDCLGVVFTLVERPDSTNFWNAKQSLKHNAVWKRAVFESYIPKRSAYSRTQLSQPFILKHDDFELRNSLKSVVDEMLEELGDV